MDEILRLEHLEKTFGTHQVLRDISFSVNKGDVISIIGSSGSGKSTMLRCVNLLEEPTGGKIIFEGKDIAGKELNLSQYRARVGMVFQQFNLFNNMNALENCVCPQLTVLHRKREEAEKIARDYLERVGMSAYCNARPAQLSGGQKQRVAIARTLSMNPDIILFDEPTSASATSSVALSSSSPAVRSRLSRCLQRAPISVSRYPSPRRPAGSVRSSCPTASWLILRSSLRCSLPISSSTRAPVFICAPSARAPRLRTRPVSMSRSTSIWPPASAV